LVEYSIKNGASVAVGLAMIAIIVLLGYTVTEDTYYCNAEPDKLLEAEFGLSDFNSKGLQTRLYLNEEHTSWDYCNNGWQRVSLFIKLINSNSEGTDESDVNNKISIIEGETKPIVTKYTGDEKQKYKVLMEDDQVCFKRKVSGRPPNKLKIYNSKDKKSYKDVEKNNESKYCLSYEDYLQYGENTIVIENQTEKSVLFSMNDNYNITANLYWDINEDKSDWSNSVNDLFVFFDHDKYKFGATHNGTDGWERYKYVISSEAQLKQIGNKYYFVDGRQGYKVLTGDICNKVNNVTNESASCQFNLFNTFDNKTNITTYNLEIEFYSDSFIDPSFVFENLESNSIFTNTRFEGDNSTHLEVSDSDILLYMPFDTNLSQATVYDYTNDDNDATFLDNAKYTSDGYIGGALSLDGADDRINVPNKMFPDDLGGGFSFSAWVRPNATFGSDAYLMDTSNRNLVVGVRSTRIFFQLRNSTGSLVNVLSVFPTFVIDQWCHVVVTFNRTSNTTLIYKDSVNQTGGVGGVISGFDSLQTNAQTTFGARELASSEYNGTLDEIMVWNRTLTQTEVTNLYNNQSDRFFNTGTQKFKEENVTMGSDNRMNLSITSFQNLLSTSINASINYWNEDDGYNVSDDGLVAYFGLNNQSSLGENNTHVFDYTGNGNNGTPTGGAIPTTNGTFAGSYNFDGSGDYIELNDGGTIIESDEVTVSAWSKVRDLENRRYVWSGRFNSGADSGLMFNNNNIQLFLYNGTQQSSSIIPVTALNTWVFTTVTWNTSSYQIYVDSVKVGNGSFGGNVNQGSTNFQIGADTVFHTSLNRNFNGTIDEFMIYNRSLSASEIKSLYQKGLANYTETAPQVVTAPNTNITFTVPSTTQNFYPKLTYISNVNNSYTPVLEGSIKVSTFESVAPSGNVPSQVENLTSPSNTSSSIYVTWDYTDIANASMFLDSVNVANVTYPTAVYNFTGLSASTTYNIIVKAFNASGTNNTVTSENNITITTQASAVNQCVYSGSGNFDINMSLGPCNITAPYNILGNNLSIFGNNTIYFHDNVTNITFASVAMTGSAFVSCMEGCMQVGII
jgi:hypothetical protein